jgi:hypothetical protein
MVDGAPVAGSIKWMRHVHPGDFEVLQIPGTSYARAIDVTDPAIPGGGESFASWSAELRDGLAALGGDDPPPGGGPAPDSNTYSYLKSHWADGALAGISDPAFRMILEGSFGTDASGRLNLEGLALVPPVDGGNDFLRALLNGDIDPATGLLADPTPPFGLYPANLNQIGDHGNPLAGLP